MRMMQAILMEEDVQMLPREDYAVVRALLGFVELPISEETVPAILSDFESWKKKLSSREQQLAHFVLNREIEMSTDDAPDRAAYYRDLLTVLK